MAKQTGKKEEKKEERHDVAAYILADHRESNGAIPYLQAAVDENNSANMKTLWKCGGGSIMYQTLNNGAVGDYTIMIPSKLDSTKNTIAAVFERKTWKDLAASIKDQRSVTQHKSLQEFRLKTGCYIYYIIEGPLTYADDTAIQHIPFKNLSAKVRSMSFKGVHSFHTKDQQGTARFLAHCARDLARLYRQESIEFPLQETLSLESVSKPISPFQDKETILKQLLSELRVSLDRYTAPSSEPVIIDALGELIKLVQGYIPPDSGDGDFDLFDASSVLSPSFKEKKEKEEKKNGGTEKEEKEEKKEIEEKKTVHVPEILSKKPVRSHDDIIMNMWCEIPKVSSKSAPILMDKIDIKDLICCPADQRAQLQKTIANLTFPDSGVRIGDAKAMEIMQTAIFGLDSAAAFAAKDIHVKILAQVPRVSRELAVLILGKLELTNICQAAVSGNKFRIDDMADSIADIQRATGKKIGKALANNVMEIFAPKSD